MIRMQGCLRLCMNRMRYSRQQRKNKIRRVCANVMCSAQHIANCKAIHCNVVRSELNTLYVFNHHLFFLLRLLLYHHHHHLNSQKITLCMIDMIFYSNYNLYNAHFARRFYKLSRCCAISLSIYTIPTYIHCLLPIMIYSTIQCTLNMCMQCVKCT